MNELIIDPRLEYENWRELRILFLDVETTMLDHNHPDFRVVQYAGVVYECGQRIDSETINILINPGLPIPPESSAIHQIYDEDVKDVPAFEDIYSRILGQIDSVHLVSAFNFRFDKGALNTELSRIGGGKIIAPFFDPLVYSRESYGFSKNKLEDIGKRFGCSTMGKVKHGAGASLHNALSDVNLLAEVTYAMAPGLPFTYSDLLQEQYRFMAQHDVYLEKRHSGKRKRTKA